ncbi:MAG TPA: DUF3574 domain-containing protein [Opitutaceae bacterium]
MKSNTAFLVAALVAFLPAARLVSADTPAPVTAAMPGDAARPESAHWLRSELYFGFGPLDAGDDGAREMRWRSFLDREVTPRFPDGLTVYDAYGQWRNRTTAATSRLRTKVLVILYEDTPANRGAIDAIRVAYKAATHDQSVLLATERVEVSF